MQFTAPGNLRCHVSTLKGPLHTLGHSPDPHSRIGQHLAPRQEAALQCASARKTGTCAVERHQSYDSSASRKA